MEPYLFVTASIDDVKKHLGLLLSKPYHSGANNLKSTSEISLISSYLHVNQELIFQLCLL